MLQDKGKVQAIKLFYRLGDSYHNSILARVDNVLLLKILKDLSITTEPIYLEFVCARTFVHAYKCTCMRVCPCMLAFIGVCLFVLRMWRWSAISLQVSSESVSNEAYCRPSASHLSSQPPSTCACISAELCIAV